MEYWSVGAEGKVRKGAGEQKRKGDMDNKENKVDEQ